MQQIYEYFSVTRYVNQLISKQDFKQLEQLHRVLSKYILVNLINDSEEEILGQIPAECIQNPSKLAQWFMININYFSEKIAQYGRNFSRQYPAICN